MFTVFFFILCIYKKYLIVCIFFNFCLLDKFGSAEHVYFVIICFSCVHVILFYYYYLLFILITQARICFRINLQ